MPLTSLSFLILVNSQAFLLPTHVPTMQLAVSLLLQSCQTLLDHFSHLQGLILVRYHLGLNTWAGLPALPWPPHCGPHYNH